MIKSNLKALNAYFRAKSLTHEWTKECSNVKRQIFSNFSGQTNNYHSKKRNGLLSIIITLSILLFVLIICIIGTIFIIIYVERIQE
jgi:hypothetical protein